MRYVEETLSNGERILKEARFHGSYDAAAWAWLILGIWLAGLGLVIFIMMMIRKATTEIAVTNRRFIFKRGWLRQHCDDVSINKLEDVNLVQSPLGRLFGFGQLRLKGSGIQELLLPAIADPIAFRTAIDNAKYGARFLTDPESITADSRPFETAVDDTSDAEIPHKTASPLRSEPSLTTSKADASPHPLSADPTHSLGGRAPSEPPAKRFPLRAVIIVFGIIIGISVFSAVAYTLMETDIVENVVTGKSGLDDDERQKIATKYKGYIQENAFAEAMSYLSPLIEKYNDVQLKTWFKDAQVGFLERQILTTNISNLDRQIDLHEQWLALEPDNEEVKRALARFKRKKAAAN